MTGLTNLELAVLDAVARQVPDVGRALMLQAKRAEVAHRENTGAGFYTTLEIAAVAPRVEVPSPLGDVDAEVAGLVNGMGFLLWMEDGYARRIEGYSYGENTSGLDFEHISFAAVGPRIG